MNESMIDAVDRKIIHALQLEPRVPWTEVAHAIGVSPATVSRRWNRLQQEGLAWVTGHPSWLGGPACTAIVEVVVEPNLAADVIAILEPMPEAFTILQTSGARDLLIMLHADSTVELWRFVNQSLCAIPGIRSVQTHLVIELSAEGKDWNLRSLSETEASAIPSAPLPQPHASKRIDDELRGILFHELGLDGRAAATVLGEKWGYCSQRILDAIAVLRAEGRLAFRTDVAHSALGWPVYAWYFIEAPAGTVQQLRKSLVNVPQIRVVAITAGRYSLMLSVWLKDLASIFDFEVAFSRVAKDSRVVDKSVVTRVVKMTGHLIDERGQATRGTIPMSPRPGPPFGG